MYDSRVSSRPRLFWFLAAFLCVHLRLFSPAPAQAQTAATGLLAPWPTPEHADLDGWTRQQFGGDTDQSDQDVRISRYHAAAYGRLHPADPLSFKLGTVYDHVHLDSGDSAVPDRLINTSIAGSKGFMLSDTWTLTTVLGIGAAGDLRGSDAEALYGLADLRLTRKLSRTARLSFLLSYDGNRTVFPDLPIPGIAYTDRLDDSLAYTVGLPFSSATWTPDDRWRVHVTYVVPVTLSAEVRYAFTDQLSTFARYASESKGYHLDGQDAHRRVFLEQNFVELGLRYAVARSLSATLSGGYAFDQKLTRGFDLRDTDTVRDFADEPFVRVGLSLAF